MGFFGFMASGFTYDGSKKSFSARGEEDGAKFFRISCNPLLHFYVVWRDVLGGGGSDEFAAASEIAF
ncbi:hypothetical protein GG496_001714 [Candidatus Fervidibacteria bacterium JGI MDM2 JNZ-1-D12]